MKKICFDLDGVICSQVEKDYEQAAPNLEMISLINHLYDQGFTIIIHTARFMGRCNEDPKKAYAQGFLFTEDQLKKWGVKYHKLLMGKPRYDLIIDDRALFFSSNLKKIKKELKKLLSL